MLGGPWYRLIVGIIGAVVLWLNQTYGTHLQATDVTSVVIGLIAVALIVIEGHVEASKNGASFNPADFVASLLTGLKDIVGAKPTTTTTTTSDTPQRAAADKTPAASSNGTTG